MPATYLNSTHIDTAHIPVLVSLPTAWRWFRYVLPVYVRLHTIWGCSSMNEAGGYSSSLLFKSIIIILLLCTCLLPSVVFPWSGTAHTSMATDAQKSFPAAIRPHLWDTVFWINEPDRNRTIKHYDIRACSWKIHKFALHAIEILREEGLVEKAFNKMGQGTHYLQDLNCPHHGIGRYERGRHENFEKKVYRGFWISSDFDGFHYVADYKVFAYNAARFSKRYISYCNRLTYNLGPDYEKYYRKLVDPLWDHTVNDCKDYWLTILWDGLGEEKYNALGLPPKVGSRAEKKLKFPTGKDLWD